MSFVVVGAETDHGKVATSMVTSAEHSGWVSKTGRLECEKLFFLPGHKTQSSFQASNNDLIALKVGWMAELP